MFLIASNIKSLIPKLVIFLLLIYTSLNKFYKFNKISLRISSIISITTFYTIWLDI